MAKELIPHAFRLQIQSWNQEQIKEAWKILKDRWKDLQMEDAYSARQQFRVGDLVEFPSRKRGCVIIGVIERFNLKSVTLDKCRLKDPLFNETCPPRWKVAPSYLRPCEKSTIPLDEIEKGLRRKSR